MPVPGPLPVHPLASAALRTYSPFGAAPQRAPCGGLPTSMAPASCSPSPYHNLVAPVSVGLGVHSMPSGSQSRVASPFGVGGAASRGNSPQAVTYYHGVSPTQQKMTSAAAGSSANPMVYFSSPMALGQQQPPSSPSHSRLSRPVPRSRSPDVTRGSVIPQGSQPLQQHQQQQHQQQQPSMHSSRGPNRVPAALRMVGGGSTSQAMSGCGGMISAGSDCNAVGRPMSRSPSRDAWATTFGVSINYNSGPQPRPALPSAVGSVSSAVPRRAYSPAPSPSPIQRGSGSTTTAARAFASYGGIGPPPSVQARYLTQPRNGSVTASHWTTPSSPSVSAVTRSPSPLPGRLLAALSGGSSALGGSPPAPLLPAPRSGECSRPRSAFPERGAPHRSPAAPPQRQAGTRGVITAQLPHPPLPEGAKGASSVFGSNGQSRPLLTVGLCGPVSNVAISPPTNGSTKPFGCASASPVQVEVAADTVLVPSTKGGNSPRRMDAPQTNPRTLPSVAPIHLGGPGGSGDMKIDSVDVIPVADVLREGFDVVIGSTSCCVETLIGQGSFGMVWSGKIAGQLGRVAVKEIEVIQEYDLENALYEGYLLKSMGKQLPTDGAEVSSSASEDDGDFEGLPLSCSGHIPVLIDSDTTALVDQEGQHDGWRIRLLMTHLEGDPLDVVMERSREANEDIEFCTVSPGLFANAARHAAELVLQLAPVFEHVCRLALHRDLNPHNILMEPGLGDRPPIFKVIDFGLSVDKDSWQRDECSSASFCRPTRIGNGGAVTWHHLDVGGDCRYWPVSAWVQFLHGCSEVEAQPALLHEYLARLDLHSLGITALQLFCELLPRPPPKGSKVVPIWKRGLGMEESAAVTQLQQIWWQYWDLVEPLHKQLMNAFHGHADWNDLKQQCVEDGVRGKIEDLLLDVRVAIRKLREACRESGNSAIARLYRLCDALLLMIGAGDHHLGSSGTGGGTGEPRAQGPQCWRAVGRAMCGISAEQRERSRPRGALSPPTAANIAMGPPQRQPRGPIERGSSPVSKSLQSSFEGREGEWQIGTPSGSVSPRTSANGNKSAALRLIESRVDWLPSMRNGSNGISGY